MSLVTLGTADYGGT
uniref:Uncharacterized protein n=1 Tax=Moniliophthora roreri TaxID=221103 RepID=A0A0W0GAV5_MONRR